MSRKLYATPALKEWRIKQEWKQYQTVNFLELILNKDMSLSTYQKIEQGRYPVATQTAIDISATLEIDFDKLWAAK